MHTMIFHIYLEMLAFALNHVINITLKIFLKCLLFCLLCHRGWKSVFHLPLLQALLL